MIDYSYFFKNIGFNSESGIRNWYCKSFKYAFACGDDCGEAHQLGDCYPRITMRLCTEPLARLGSGRAGCYSRGGINEVDGSHSLWVC